jgi:formamidopyrimidine-DNA glycosylase
MPELPEVETVCRGLAPALVGKQIQRVELRRPDLRFPFPKDFVERLQGRKVIALRRRAKYLIAPLDDGTALIAHLGMSGSFRIENGAEPPFDHRRARNPAHDHVVIELGSQAVIYNDPRRFGFMCLADQTELESLPIFVGLGVEPLSDKFDAKTIARLFAGRTASLKVTLLDQRLIAGLGNIYVCEALHRARLAPDKPAGEIVRPDGAPTRAAEELARSIRDVLEEAITAGGSSLRDHRQADGSLGYFQHNFRVYNRAGQPCMTKNCRGTIEKRTQNGRSTFSCPKCQK